MIQTTKKRIDTGEPEQPDSGDTIHDGGNKINSNIDNIYNAFGDYRYFIAGNGNAGVGNMTIHATGYYQKYTSQYYASNTVDIGSLHDIDTTTGPVRVRLPSLLKGRRRGELITIINSSGSCSFSNPIIIETTGSDVIVEQSSLTITEPYIMVTLCVTDESETDGKWMFGTQSLFSQNATPPTKTYAFTNEELTIPLFNTNSYNGAKLLISVFDKTLNSKLNEFAEVLLSVQDTDVRSTEYARIKGTKTLYSAKYEIKDNFVNLMIKGVDTNSAKITVKILETIKEGV